MTVLLLVCGARTDYHDRRLPVTISFRITAEDLAALSEHVAFARYGNLVRARAFWAGVVVAVLVSILLHSQVHEPISSIIVGVVIGGVTALSLPKIQKDRLKKRALKLYRSGRDSSIGDHNVTLDDAGIHSSCSLSSGTVAWAAVNSIEFTQNYLFVFLGPAKAIVIPRAFIADPAIVETTLRDLTDVPFSGTWDGMR
ncbi:MAG TPA: YcxB family protein [Thermoanaerobaculia bacterium]|jgi:hypothetical protein